MPTKLRPLPPVVAMARPPPTALSPLEHLLLGREKPVSMLTHIYHTRFLETNPADHLASILPPSSLLALRVASSTTNDWVEEHHPELLQRLCVTCPLPRFSLRSSSTLRYLARECTHLTVRVLPADGSIIAAGNMSNPAPATQVFDIVKTFSTLRIEPASAKGGFELLLALRQALESADLKNLTEIHFEPLSNAGLLALRWGGGLGTFESPSGTTDPASVFRTLKSLRLGMTTAGYVDKPYDPLVALTMERITGLKKARNTYRLSIQCLHNYLYHFARSGQLQKLHFEWIDGAGLNPLLLDEEITKVKKGWKWFSAPGITWRGLLEIWLGGVKVTAADVHTMKERMEGLERVFVGREEAAAAGMVGRVVFQDGKEWLEVDLDAASLKTPGSLSAGKGMEVVDGYEEETEGSDTLCNETEEDGEESMVVPFVLRL
ncbi:MAG: hypothetical protein LQ352_003609 [Teloschistes flavicans]|nr:MAG: hypothetical protein LQ352_003609 [Teloschistes flavicans]